MIALFFLFVCPINLEPKSKTAYNVHWVTV